MVNIHAARYFLTHRPPVMPREHIVGYVFRAVHVGGTKRMKDLVAALVDRQVMQPPWTLPSNLDGLFRNLAPVFASPQEIALEHTCLPAHLPFVSPAVLDQLNASVYAGKKVHGLPAALGLAGRAVVSKPEMALCTACVREETLRHGYAWWHREHALAGIDYCPHHGRPLMAGCRRCRFSQPGCRTPRLPTMKCWCGEPHKTSQPAVSEGDAEVLTRVAQLGLKLLEGALAGRTPAELGAFYYLRAQETGFAAGSRINSPRLACEMLAKYSPAVLRRLNASMMEERGWLHKRLGARMAPNMLGRNLLLLDFFGGEIPTGARLAQARAHLSERASRSSRGYCRIGKGSSTLQVLIEDDRRAIQEFVKANPGATRTLVLKKLASAVVRARKRDAAWYDALLPSARAWRRPRTDEEAESYWRAFDERTSAHVLQRRRELLTTAGGYPKAITRTALLKGTPRGNQLTEKMLERLPRTAEALAQSVETTRQYKLRYAQCILELSATGREAVMEAQRRTGLPLTEVDRLNMRLTLLKKKA